MSDRYKDWATEIWGDDELFNLIYDYSRGNGGPSAHENIRTRLATLLRERDEATTPQVSGDIAEAVRAAAANHADVVNQNLAAHGILFKINPGIAVELFTRHLAPTIDAVRGKVGFVMGYPGENLVARYDRIAEQYHRETHHFAPGKSVPAAFCYDVAEEERARLYNEWYDKKFEEARTALALLGEKKEEK